VLQTTSHHTRLARYFVHPRLLFTQILFSDPIFSELWSLVRELRRSEEDIKLGAERGESVQQDLPDVRWWQKRLRWFAGD
jgi:hypothetical protein